MTYTPTRLVAVACNARGMPVGESHHAARHSDAVVAQARELRAQGWTYNAIGESLGVPMRTVQAWCDKHKRRAAAPARVVMRRKPIEDNQLEQ